MSNRWNGTAGAEEDHVIDERLSSFDSSPDASQMLHLRLVDPDFVPLVQRNIYVIGDTVALLRESSLAHSFL